MKRKIVTVLGARPQFIKAAFLSRLLKNSTIFTEIIIHTGQHYDLLMSDIFFKELELPKPEYSLQIHGGNHGQMTARMMESIEKVLLEENPVAVMVYGDTNSTLAGALVAVKLAIPVIHVEAGLRSFNKKMPEEINRILADHVSAVLFCPTKTAVSNLKDEGIVDGVYHVGDIMYDAYLFAVDFLRMQPNYVENLRKKLSFINENFAFLTIHRAESTSSDAVFKEVLDYVVAVAKQQKLQTVFVVHPRSRELVNKYISKFNSSIKIIDPVSYIETQFILSKAKLVLTDSGGLQKEAYFHKVPCITLRSETEWVETVKAGWNMLWDDNSYDNSRSSIGDYGRGDTAKKMLEIISANF